MHVQALADLAPSWAVGEIEEKKQEKLWYTQGTWRPRGEKISRIYTGLLWSTPRKHLPRDNIRIDRALVGSVPKTGVGSRSILPARGREAWERACRTLSDDAREAEAILKIRAAG